MLLTPPVHDNMILTPPATREPSPLKRSWNHHRQSLGYTTQAISDWESLKDLKSGTVCVVDGVSIDIADVVGVAKYGADVQLSSDPRIHLQIEQSIQTLHRHLKSGHLVYGVNTGFGGSADTRTEDVISLQRALIQMQESGVLTSVDTGAYRNDDGQKHFDDFDTAFDMQSMPTSWVRASMLARCNSIIRGHSAVRAVVAETILLLLRYEITPVVPLRGSVSASGDLSPLSYIAGAIEGSPDIYCRIGKGRERIVTAEQALKEFNIEPIILQAKEGLGLLNGTAFSAGVASLALHQSQQLALLSQALTAMGTEALSGTAESFFPKIAEMRPHPGQIEAASNILSFLSESKLAACVEGPKETRVVGLCQDRYALRTSSQWIGPQLEDLHHAHEQVRVELNSTTDNPLIDVESDEVLHGGNFQAAVVTSAMDRTRLALDKFGRMLFSQASEMINPVTNRGLPANLASDDPSLSFTCKGVDINMAAYTSELGFLANPVGSHVNSAEMHNQSINSVALISARYTFQALDTLRILSAAYLFTVCQALDLRVQNHIFLEQIRPLLLQHLTTTLPTLTITPALETEIWSSFSEAWPSTTTFDLADRVTKTMEALLPTLISHLSKSSTSTTQPIPISDLTIFTSTGATLLTNTYRSVQAYLASDRTAIVTRYLGTASAALYTFIRTPSPTGLGVSFHQGLIEHPTQPAPVGWSTAQVKARKTIGSQIGIIYEALRDGRVHDVVVEMAGGVMKG